MKKQKISKQLKSDLDDLFEYFDNEVYYDPIYHNQFKLFMNYCNKNVGLVFAFYDYVDTLTDQELSDRLSTDNHTYTMKEIQVVRNILKQSESDWIENNQKGITNDYLYNT